METKGYNSKQYAQPTKRYVQTMDLNDNTELIRRYREAHNKDHFWKDIGKGIKQVGILEMEIYIQNNRLVMIVDTPADFDWDKAMAKLATLAARRNGNSMYLPFSNVQPMPQATRSGI